MSSKKEAKVSVFFMIIIFGLIEALVLGVGALVAWATGSESWVMWVVYILLNIYTVYNFVKIYIEEK